MEVSRMMLMVSACLLAALCSTGMAQKGTCDGRPPNMIVVMVDDLGYHDLGIHGSQDVLSPNIDKLMMDGCRFSEGYSVAGFCSPARAGFITGIHPYHIGHIKNPARDAYDTNAGLPLDLTIIPETLKTRGYTSAMIGKWHLGVHAFAHPLSRGFDYFMGFLGSGFPYFEWKIKFRQWYEYIFENYEYYTKVKYLTDDFTDAAIRFINKSKKKPFFIFLAYNAVHGPYDYLSRDINSFASEDRQPHVAMIQAVDRGIGKLRNKLESLGLDKCTMIVFTNDNGGHANGASNYPLFDYKGKLWEGGIRVPLSFTYPGVIEAGQVSTELASLIDIYPTMQAIAGVERQHRNKDIKGVNLYPHMIRAGESKPRDPGPSRPALINRKPGKAIVRQGWWKLWLDTRKKGGSYPKPFAMYNLQKDVGETKNLIARQGARAKRLRALFIEWDRKTKKEVFPGRFRKSPLNLYFTTLPKNKRARVGKDTPFAAKVKHDKGRKMDSVHWEIFEPGETIRADYNQLPIDKSKFEIIKPKSLKPTITFKAKGTFVVRVNVQALAWLDWADVTVEVR